jgi:putative transcriptional regulator
MTALSIEEQMANSGEEDKVMKKSKVNLTTLKKALEELKRIKKQEGCSARVENIDVYAIRQKYHFSQEEFSRRFGFSPRTLQEWEQGRRKPRGSARILLKVIEGASDVVEKVLRS